MIYCILKYHKGEPENKSALSAVLKPYYLRFAFWKRKLRLNYQYVHHEIWVLALIEEPVLTWERLYEIKERNQLHTKSQ